MAIGKKSLGRGIDALMMSSSIDDIDENQIKHINILNIYPNPDQPRRSFDEEALNNLAGSIKEHGIVQPILVKKKNQKYMIIAGERRYRAAQIAGMTTMPCIPVDYDEGTIAKIALVENLQREDLNIVEEANAYQRLITIYKLTQEQVSDAVGKSRSHVANTLRLLKLSDPVMTMVVEGKLSGGHARTLLRLESPERQLEFANRIISQGMSVRDIENMVQKEMDNKGSARIRSSSKSQKAKTPEVKNLELRLEDLLGTKVLIKEGNANGKIEIDFYGEDDLDRILKLIL